jgi:SAM-dependent methyltransferase
MPDVPRPLDAEALTLFARKGREGGPNVPQAGEANGVKVRRVLQVTSDLAGKPFERLRVLDLGCGEGVYAIEAGLRGAEVLALDARTERMSEGQACADRHGLSNVRFRQEDVRRVSRATHGEFDVAWCLGLLYHLEAPEAFALLESLATLARLLVVDTLVSLEGAEAVEHRGRAYRGERVREHEDQDPPEVRRARLLRSIDSTFAFRFTRASLVRAIHAAGFSTVLEAHAPAEPGKAADRVTLAAVRGEPVRLSTYPWVNGASDEEIARRLGAPPPAS